MNYELTNLGKMSSHRTKRCLSYTSIYTEKEKLDKMNNMRGIHNLIDFLEKYTYDKNENTLKDISEYSASSYRNVLVNFVCNESNAVYEKDVEHLIYICLYIIKKNLRHFIHQNIYFVCLNTLFFLLKLQLTNKMLFEIAIVDIFNELLNDSTKWLKDGHISLFGKLSFVTHFVTYMWNNDWFLKETLYINAFKKVLSNVFIQQYIKEENNKEETTYNISLRGSYDNHLEAIRTGRYKYEYTNNVKKNSSHKNTHYITPNKLSEIKCEIMENKIYKEIKIIKRNSMELKKRPRVVMENNGNTFSLKEEYLKKEQFLNECHSKCMEKLNTYLYFDIYKSIINLIIEHDLSIYIIEECVAIILKLCCIKKGYKIVYDYLMLYKFYIKKDHKKSERFLFFVITLIQKTKIGKEKMYFLKLIHSATFFFFLMNSENSELRICSEMALFQWSQLNRKNKTSDKKYKQNKTIRNNSKEPNCSKKSDNSFIEKQYVNMINMILFHLNYIEQLSLKTKSIEEKRIISEEKEKIYEQFFNMIETDEFGRFYMQNSIKKRKLKLFMHPLYKIETTTLIRNNINEIEKVLSVFLCYFRFFIDIKFFTSFIIFIIYLCKYIEKLCDKLPVVFSRNFFFVVKKIFIQTKFMMDNLRDIEEEILKSKEKEKNNLKKKSKRVSNSFRNMYDTTRKTKSTYIEDKEHYHSGDSFVEQMNLYIKTLIYKETNKEDMKNLYTLGKVKQLIRKIEDEVKQKNGNYSFLLLKELFKTIVNFLLPLKKKGIFFTSAVDLYYKDLLLSIINFYYKYCDNFSIDIKTFFFFYVFNRIKKKTISECFLKETNTKVLLNSLKWITSVGNKMLSEQKKTNNNENRKEHKNNKKQIYISLKINNYWGFLLDFLKTFIMIDGNEKLVKKKKIIQNIISFCKIPLLKYKFFESSKSRTNCFVLSIEVLYYLYKKNSIVGKNKKFFFTIVRLLLFSADKALRSLNDNNKIFYHKKDEMLVNWKKEKMELKKLERKVNNKKKANSKKKCLQSLLNNQKNFKNSNVPDGNAETNKVSLIKITNEFVKPYKAYYFNNSLVVFVACIGVLTNIVKIQIKKEEFVNTSIIIKESKIKRIRKRMKRKKKYYLLNENIFNTYELHILLAKFCHWVLKITDDDNFYSVRLYVLQFIQHLITWNNILVLKYKYSNVLHLKSIINFCFSTLSTHFDIEIFPVIYSITFSLKTFLSFCYFRIKRPGQLREACDLLINEVLEHYNGFDYSEFEIWEKLYSKEKSLEILKDTHIDCPGN